MSTTETGNAFRDLVCELLRTKYPDAQVEQLIAGTKVDIRFTAESDFGERKVYAVECKDYARPLTKDVFANEIYGPYSLMQNSGLVDHVLIISRKPLGAAAGDFIKTWKNAQHRTYDELAEALLGVRRYIQDLSTLRPNDEIAYIEARIDGREGHAIELVDTWVNRPEGRGLAVRGSYGQGKTSFAKRLAAMYAQRHLEDAAQRMPILYRLGEVVHETRLEALFGAMFTAGTNVASGYRFSTFEHLNRAGRLLIILDGFDEMKHAMTAADFYANFKEFNRLLVGEAKVVLLGRPNALPSDVEELVFRGEDRVAGQTVASTQFQPWEEWRLDFFTHEETESLLGQALAAFVDRHQAARRYSYTDGYVSARVKEILSKVPDDLLRRPVHVHLVAELGAEPNFDFQGFNEFKLYDHFIRTMVERDVEKKPRRAIPVEARLAFQRELAWWAWSRTGASQGFFLRKDIPASLLKNLAGGDSADDEGKLNEYIVSTLTENKEGGGLFFAHRSFQEFLVAERVRKIAPSPAAHAEYSAFITPDVISFLRQAPDTDYLLDWHGTLGAATGPFTSRYFDFLASHSVLVQHIRELSQATGGARVDPWSICLLAIATRESTPGAMTDPEMRSYLSKRIRMDDGRLAAAATLAMLTSFRKTLNAANLIELSAALIERCLRRCRSKPDGDALTFDRANADFATKWLGEYVTRIFPQQGQVTPAVLHYDVADLEEACAVQLGIAHQSAELHPLGMLYSDPAKTAWPVEAAKVYARIDKKLQEQFQAYLRARKDKFVVVDVGYARKTTQRMLR